MAPHGKELSEDLKKRIVALHKDGVSYTKIAKTLKLSCSPVAKTITGQVPLRAPRLPFPQGARLLSLTILFKTLFNRLIM